MATKTISDMKGAPEGRRTVVAAVLTSHGRASLFRRSEHVTGDVGRWHCITGFLPSHKDPLSQAILEIEEEAGITECKLDLQRTAIIDQKDADGNIWQIHAFHFRSLTEVVRLNWEHDMACWIRPEYIPNMLIVDWLGSVLRALSITAFGSEDGTSCSLSALDDVASVSATDDSKRSALLKQWMRKNRERISAMAKPC